MGLQRIHDPSTIRQMAKCSPSRGCRRHILNRTRQYRHLSELLALRCEASFNRKLVPGTTPSVSYFASGHFGERPKKVCFTRIFPLKTAVWLGAESNRRHVDFQSMLLTREIAAK